MEPHSLIILRIRLSNFALTDFSQCGERYTDVLTSRTLSTLSGIGWKSELLSDTNTKVQSYFAFLKIRRMILFFFNFESPTPLKEKTLGILESDKK